MLHGSCLLAWVPSVLHPRSDALSWRNAARGGPRRDGRGLPHWAAALAHPDAGHAAPIRAALDPAQPAVLCWAGRCFVRAWRAAPAQAGLSSSRAMRIRPVDLVGVANRKRRRRRAVRGCADHRASRGARRPRAAPRQAQRLPPVRARAPQGGPAIADERRQVWRLRLRRLVVAMNRHLGNILYDTHVSLVSLAWRGVSPHECI